MVTTEPGAAIHSLDHVVIGVPDLVEAERFYGAFGLRTDHTGDGLDLYCFGHAHRWIRLVPTPTKKLQRVVFGAYAGDLAAIRDRLTALDARLLPTRNDGIDFIDPDGNAVSVVAAEKSSPDVKAMPSVFHDSVAPGRFAAPLRSKVDAVRPRRLAHVLFFTPDIQRAIDFYCAAMGLRLSDEAGDVAFLHGVHGSDHHLVAFATGPAPGVHHLAWDVGSVQEVGVGMAQMVAAGYDQGWGVGRHVLGSNYFYYARDPWGSYCEYSFDIDYIPSGTGWKSGHVPAEDGFYLWGPAPPADFAVNHEAIGNEHATVTLD